MAESKKIGRGKRQPARAAYSAGARWEVNKAKRIARHKKCVALAKANPPAVPRGTARKVRRARINWAEVHAQREGKQ
jgi:hypothetical protein